MRLKGETDEFPRCLVSLSSALHCSCSIDVIEALRVHSAAHALAAVRAGQSPEQRANPVPQAAQRAFWRRCSSARSETNHSAAHTAAAQDKSADATSTAGVEVARYRQHVLLPSQLKKREVGERVIGALVDNQARRRDAVLREELVCAAVS